MTFNNISGMFCRRALLTFMVAAWGFSTFSQNSGSSLADIKIAADAGDPAAQDKLAEQFVSRADMKNAELWYRRSAEQGFTHAEGKLGNLLLMRSRSIIGTSEPERAKLGEEALKWATMAGNAGDKRAQADLAEIYFQGKLVKQDLIESYKWGDLAAQGSAFDTATISGRSNRDAAILKMSAEQIFEAKKRVVAFTAHKPTKDGLPESGALKKLKLSGLAGPANNRLAIINGATFAKGETQHIKIDGMPFALRCVEIREGSVIVAIEGEDKPRELFMKTGIEQPIDVK
jgi:hypothetical protein